MKANIITKYLHECFEEFNKVTWPTKNQAIRSTAIVLGFTLIVSLFITAVDYGFQIGFTELIKNFRLPSDSSH